MELCVHNYIEETRLAKLTSLQEKFLKHAMNAFPKAKRIVYSTCSLFPEENERVITNVVKASRAKWKVQDVKELLKGQWNNFGSSMYGSMGTRCIYAKPDSDFTIGFFLAVLDRDPKDAEKRQRIEHTKLSTENIVTISTDNEELKVDTEYNSKKIKKRKRIDANEEIETLSVSDIGKKKKKKNKDPMAENSVNEDFKNNFSDVPIHIDDPRNRKKKEKQNRSEDTSDKPIESEITDISLETVKKKKKKTKSQESEEHDSESLNETTAVVQEDTKKKKNKRKHVSDASEMVDESRTFIEESPKKKKQKKHKNLI